MAAIILDGKVTANGIREEIAQDVLEMQEKHGVTPGLAAILTGDDPASAIYVRNKERASGQVGIYTETFRLPHNTSQDQLMSTIASLNNDPKFHGILVQLPLPDQLDEKLAIASLRPEKDVDGIHPVNIGRLASGDPHFVPCTPAGTQQLLVRNGFSPEGKRVVICGRSNIVGVPLAMLLMQKRPGANATVTVCHTGTKELAEVTRQADILVAAMGRPSIITADMLREGVIVVDVGINRVPDDTRERGYRIEGDVDFPNVVHKAQAISPVPGGVGPMTIAMLLANTFKAAKISIHGER